MADAIPVHHNKLAPAKEVKAEKKQAAKEQAPEQAQAEERPRGVPFKLPSGRTRVDH